MINCVDDSTGSFSESASDSDMGGLVTADPSGELTTGSLTAGGIPSGDGETDGATSADVSGHEMTAKVQGATRRMMVVLSPAAVERQTVGPNDRMVDLFPDQRVQRSPRAWSAVSLQTALVVRDIEDLIGAKALVTFGNLTHGFGAELTPNQIAILRADPRVQDVFIDPLGELAANPPGWLNYPGFGPGYHYTHGYNLYAIDAITGSPAWNSNAVTPSYRTQGGYPVKAYVIDSGIQPHFDLNFDWKTDHISFDCHKNVGGNGCVEGQAPVYKYVVACDSHATQVAGVIGARREGVPLGVEGVAPGAHLVSVKVNNYCHPDMGYPGLVYLSGVVAAINWIAAQVPNNGFDAKFRRRLSAVVNMSILWSSTTPQHDLYIPPAGQSALSKAVSAAVAKGIFFSFAAGNDSSDACGLYPARIGSQVNGAMAVGGLSNGGAVMQAPNATASYGPCVEIWAPGQGVQSTGAFPGISAQSQIVPDVPWSGVWGPGVPLQPTTSNLYPGQHYILAGSGSSMAAPHAAGAALLLARKRQMLGQPLPSPAEVEQVLLAKTKILPPPFDKYGGLSEPPSITPLPVRVLTVDQF